MAVSKVKKLSTSNTKQEMLDAYNDLLQEIDNKKGQELKPTDIIKEKENKKIIEDSETITEYGIDKILIDLKKEFNRSVSNLESQLESTYGKYESLKKAVLIKESELKEVYDIDHYANTLAALIEAYNIKKSEFEEEMENLREEFDHEMKLKRETFQNEMLSKKEAWELEKKNYANEIKERDADEQKRRQREKEDFVYSFEKEKRITLDSLNNQKVSLEKEIKEMKEKFDKEMSTRESNILANEKEFNELKAKAAKYDKDLELAVSKAVKEATEKIITESKHKEEILQKEIEGERKLYSAQISSLEKSLKEQNELIFKLQNQIEKSYLQVQDIAIRAVDGSTRKQSTQVQSNNQES